MDALPTLRVTMQQKAEKRDTMPDLFLKHPNTTVSTYI
jgi:hypothetical protein